MTLKVDADVLLWARARAMFAGTSVNALIRGFLEERAAVPPRWLERLPPRWTTEGTIVELMDPVGAGYRASEGAHAQADMALDAISEASSSRQG